MSLVTLGVQQQARRQTAQHSKLISGQDIGPLAWLYTQCSLSGCAAPGLKQCWHKTTAAAAC